MNPYKYLIWEYSSNKEDFFDATELVDWIKDGGNAYLVKFKSKETPIYVSYSNISFYENPMQVDFLVIEHNGVPQYKVKHCLKFGDKYKLFFENGYISTYCKEEIRIYKDELKNNPTAKGILNYYRRVVQMTAKTEEDAFMLSQFDAITNINEDSVLALYLKGQNGKSVCSLDRPIISPFGTNLSQMEAVKTAFKYRISIIEGPPGTGKTQTILNLIANAVTKGYKIAIVSNNNSAIENINEKLQKYNFDFLCALLGNKDNTEAFFENLKTQKPDLTTNERTKNEKIGEYNYSLPYLFEQENKKNKLLENRQTIELEHKHFLYENKEFDFNQFQFKTTKLSSNKLMNVIVFLSEYHKTKLSFYKKYKLRRMIKCSKTFFMFPVEDQILLLQNQYFLVRIKDIDNEIIDIDSELKNRSFDEILDDYKKASIVAFKNSLKELFKDKRNNSYDKTDYKKNFEQFVQDFPVILSSTYALAQCTKNGFLFDYLIVDESSQVNMASAILSMRVAKNIVVVGDIKQLPQIDDHDFANTNKELLEQYGVDESYSYYGHSILSSILSVYKDDVPRTLLKEHYRCNSQIIGFCNEEFYNNQLVIYSKNNNDKPLRLISLVAGNHARKNPLNEGGFYSEREADEISLIVHKEKPIDLGVISPYKAQVKTITNKLNSSNIEVSTIHKFQGREKKNIILSTVVNDSNDFVDDPNMINVAVSRAIDSFTLIASNNVTNAKSGVISDLVHYIKYHEDFSDVQEGNVSSVFDILYGDYSKQLEMFRKKHPSNEFDSENIVSELIKEILQEERFKNLKMSMHIPLRQILHGKFIDLNKDEIRFFYNPWTHADFVIYNKYSNQPVAIIEVDGVSFHEQQQRQVERDTMKDNILTKANISFIRLKTNESNEKQRIINLLSA